MSHHDLIVFGEDWGGLPSSTQHLIAIIAENRKVIWINSIGLRKVSLSVRDISRAWTKVKRFVTPTENNHSEPQSHHKNITFINPLTIPAPSSLIMRWVASFLLVRQIKPIVAREQLNTPVLWTSLPTASDLAGKLGDRGLVYYVGDDFSGLAGVDHKIVQQHETRLTKKSDLVITASNTLYEKFPADKTRLLTHGVDRDLFTQKHNRAHDLPSGKPIAGFYGSISQWLDIELLVATIAAKPDWNFVFIGEAHVDIAKLQALPNTFFLGPKKHKDLPSYSQHWDASLLPFKRNKQIMNCNPLKLMEYLSVGKPIICTDFPAISPYREILHTIENSGDFTEALTQIKNAQQKNETQLRMQGFTQHDGWRSKADTVCDWIDTL